MSDQEPAEFIGVIGEALKQLHGRQAERAEAVRKAREDAQVRRSRVLRYEDLAKQLTQPPIGYSSPERWNGYIPPRTDPPAACRNCRSDSPSRDQGCQGPHAVAENTSPRRKALVELAAEALRREQANELVGAGT